jgi:hypothetical protein
MSDLACWQQLSPRATCPESDESAPHMVLAGEEEARVRLTIVRSSFDQVPMGPSGVELQS